jgi:hypothetical protein
MRDAYETPTCIIESRIRSICVIFLLSLHIMLSSQILLLQGTLMAVGEAPVSLGCLSWLFQSFTWRSCHVMVRMLIGTYK